MARSFFCFYPGLPSPDRFRVGPAPLLLSLQDLWDEARGAVPSLIFRVRSESEPGANLTVGDKLESCVGMIDSATRWRSVFNMTRTAINAVRHPVLAEACLKAMQFISTQHPAAVSPAQRHGILMEIIRIAETQQEGQPDANPFEKEVARGVGGLVMCDNDIEAASITPFVRSYCPFDKDTQKSEFHQRMASIETVAGSVLLSEAANRLSERLPSWCWAAMPELKPPGAPDREAPPPQEDDED